MTWIAILAVHAPGMAMGAAPHNFIVAETDARAHLRILAQTTTLEAARAAYRLLA